MHLNLWFRVGSNNANKSFSRTKPKFNANQLRIQRVVVDFQFHIDQAVIQKSHLNKISGN